MVNISLARIDQRLQKSNNQIDGVRVNVCILASMSSRKTHIIFPLTPFKTAPIHPNLLYGYTLRQIPGLVDVRPALDGDVVCEQLQRDGNRNGIHKPGCLGYPNHIICDRGQ